MIATSIEQSKRLLELGLKPETADMHYTVFNPEVPVSGKPFLFNGEDLVIPAWSLSALLELIPKEIEFSNESLPLSVHLQDGKWACRYGNHLNINNVLMIGDTLIEAVLIMIKWLIEKDYITELK